MAAAGHVQRARPALVGETDDTDPTVSGAWVHLKGRDRRLSGVVKANCSTVLGIRAPTGKHSHLTTLGSYRICQPGQ